MKTRWVIRVVAVCSTLLLVGPTCVPIDWDPLGWFAKAASFIDQIPA